MDVIRHDHVFFYPNCRIPRRDRLYLFFHDLANGRQRDRGRGKPLPYGDIREDAAAVVGADRDEIGAGRGIVVVWKTDLFSLGKNHLRLPFFVRHVRLYG